MEELDSLENTPQPKGKSKIIGLLIAIGTLFAALAALVASVYFMPVRWGMWGTAVGEGVLLVVAVIFALLLRQPLRETFPVKRVKKTYFTGSVFIYIGVWMLMYIASISQALLFPRMTEVSQQLSSYILSESFLVSAFIICVTPAICEEALCRGTILSALRFKQIWIRMLIGGAIFGILHGDPLRMLPTAMLGAALCYITIKTGSLVYSVILHFVNNLFSLSMSHLSEILLNMSEDLSSDTPVLELDQAVTAAIEIGTLVSFVLMSIGGAMLFIYGGRRRLNDLGLHDIDRKKRRAVQLAAIILIGVGVAAAIVSCTAGYISTIE